MKKVYIQNTNHAMAILSMTPVCATSATSDIDDYIYGNASVYPSER